MKIVVIGSTNTDMVIKTSHLPLPGETILGGEFLINPGGKGANQAVAASRLGGDVAFISKTGNDIFGEQSVENLRREGVNTENIVVDPENPSGVALITVDSRAENCIVVAPGSNMTLKPDDIDKAIKQIEMADIVLLQLEIPIETVEYTAQIAFRNEKRVILNPAPAQKLSDSILKTIYILTPNETEAEILTGVKVTNTDTAKKAAQILLKKSVEIVIITMGANGAFVHTNSLSELIPAPEVKAVDTTAAGDTFNGALAVAVSEGFNIREAVQFANKAASIAVTRLGAQTSTPYRSEVGEKRVRSNSM
ncbi:MAG: ribokinase [Bacteroidetes bacterium]|nr:ribokinase [Bacteroidota bacterium]